MARNERLIRNGIGRSKERLLKAPMMGVGLRGQVDQYVGELECKRRNGCFLAYLSNFW